MNKSGYVYKVTNIQTGQFYIGTRAFSQSAGIIDIGETYFTASSNKSFVNEFKNNPDNFETKIIYSGTSFLDEKFSAIKKFGTFADNKKSLNLRNLTPKFTGFGKTGLLNHLFGKKINKTNSERKERIYTRLNQAKKLTDRKQVRLGNLIIKVQDQADIKLFDLQQQIKSIKKQMGKLHKIKNVSEHIVEIKELKNILKTI